jgi:steroid 5-alpha reductase family enzyme
MNFEEFSNILSFKGIDSFQLCIMSQKFSYCMEHYDPLISTSWLLCIIIAYSFIWSIIGNNCSKVDQIWSITPWLYGWMFWYHSFLKNGYMHNRLTLLVILMSLWGIRLTFNFWRRGGYGNLITHEEDYRWPILRAKMNKFVFLVFNLTFIATYQNILLWLIVIPAYIVSKENSIELTNIDIILAVIMTSLIIMETVADQQQYDFQQYKHSLSITNRNNHKLSDIRDGFLQRGLWKYSRHPNYFAEQAIWICVYLFSVSARYNLYNYSCMGCILLMLLFQGSIAFAESITLSKYPKYKIYQQTTSCCIPFFRISFQS